MFEVRGGSGPVVRNKANSRAETAGPRGYDSILPGFHSRARRANKADWRDRRAKQSQSAATRCTNKANLPRADHRGCRRAGFRRNKANSRADADRAISVPAEPGVRNKANRPRKPAVQTNPISVRLPTGGRFYQTNPIPDGRDTPPFQSASLSYKQSQSAPQGPPDPLAGRAAAKQSQFPPVRPPGRTWNGQLPEERGNPPPYAGHTSMPGVCFLRLKIGRGEIQ